VQGHWESRIPSPKAAWQESRPAPDFFIGDIMTVPAERSRAVVYTEEFLLSLLDPKKTPRVPKAIRDKAYRLLKHYPGKVYLKQSAEKLPDIWGNIDD
jgi:hypothetical protein